MSIQHLSPLALQIMLESGTIEWYDNSLVNVITNCERRAMYQTIGPKGIPLGDFVGDGGTFGNVVHAGLDFYYDHFNDLPYPERSGEAVRAAWLLYERKFDLTRQVGSQPGEIDKKHVQFNLGVVLNGYFAQHKSEDERLKVVYTENSIAFLVKYEPGDPFQFEPFFYIVKMDRLLQEGNELAVLETKTIGWGDVVKRANLLEWNNQPLGYIYVVRKWLEFNGALDGRTISSFIPDVILVSATTLSYHRMRFPLIQHRLDSWRRETIVKVQRWREYKAFLVKHFSESNFFDLAPKNTERCNDYGGCPFYRLCSDGPMSPTLQDYKPDTWHPFNDLTLDRIHYID